MMSESDAPLESGTAGEPLGWLLFAFLGGALAWTIHFLGSYAVLGIGCAGGWGASIPIILLLGTLVLTGVAVWAGLLALRGWRRAGDGQSWDRALSEPRGWVGFLMMAGLLLSVISAFTILLEGIPSLFVPACGSGSV